VRSELGVNYILGGTVDVQGERARASVELIDTKTGLRAWSGSFERNGTELPLIADEVIHNLGRELQIRIERLEMARDPQNLEVRALVFRGWAAQRDAGKTGLAGLQQSEQYFMQALAREPKNTGALLGLASYHVRMVEQLYTPDPAPHLAKAEELLQQVLERRPDAGGPPYYLGLLNAARGRTDEAAKWFERELALNPSMPAYSLWYSPQPARSRPGRLAHFGRHRRGGTRAFR
jgi:tetratricopeptide (TPR) repeat protein